MSDLFGRRLRAYRKLKRLTQMDLAEQMGVGISTIGSLERGTRVPTQELFTRLLKVLNVTESELLGTLDFDELQNVSQWPY